MHSGDEEIFVTVIVPCRDEVTTIRQVLDDLQAQSWQGKFEVIIAEGRSADGTRALLGELQREQKFRFSLQVVDNLAGGIPHGLNAAVRASHGTHIVRVDPHSRLSVDYVELIIEALTSSGHDVVGPRLIQIPGSPGLIPGAIATLLGSWLGSGGTPSRSPLLHTMRVEHTVMSCYRKDVWQQLGGYDEHLGSNEDFDFDFRAMRAGALIASLPTPIFSLVARATLLGLARQRWRYGWWKAAVVHKFTESVRWRQVIPVMSLAALTLLVVASVVWPWTIAVASLLVAVYLGACWLSAVTSGTARKDIGVAARCAAVVFAPVIFAIIHVVWASGLVVGLMFNRYRGPKPDQPSPTLIPRSRDLPGQPRIAVVHEWLETCGGSEQVLAEILKLLPQARLFSLVDFRDKATDELLRGRLSTTSPLQLVPGARWFFRWLLPAMPMAIEQLDLAEFDLVISSSHAVAKGVVVRPYARHLCYCHSPLRYAWDQQSAYSERGALGRGPRRWFILWVLHRLRQWDVTASARVDHFIANSSFVAERIARYYRRAAVLIHPPVAIEDFPLCEVKGTDYVVVSRLVPYKRIDVVIEAFNRMPLRTLVVVGTGSEQARLMAIAGPNIRFTGFVSNQDLVKRLGAARAFVFAAEEDFGIAMVEAMACGTPVIAFASGGSMDLVVDGVTGVLADYQSAAAFVHAVEQFEQRLLGQLGAFAPHAIRQHAEQFSTNRFHLAMKQQILDALAELTSAGNYRPRAIFA